VDWTIVVSTAITGAVGVAGVAGTIIAARIAGNSTRETARLTISAENRRVRLADKRRVYARALATMDAAVTAVKAERDFVGGKGTATHSAPATDAALLAAADAMGELQLAAPRRIPDLAERAMDDLAEFRRGGSDDERIRETRRSLFEALRTDLDEEAKRGN
jgi:hypothetical protein